MLQKHNETLVAQTAVSELRNRSVARGTEPNPGEAPLELSRAATHWNIYLPLGSSEGPHEVRIAGACGESLVATSVEAKLKDHITLLEVTVSLRSAPAGRYLLQVRKAGLE